MIWWSLVILVAALPVSVTVVWLVRHGAARLLGIRGVSLRPGGAAVTEQVPAWKQGAVVAMCVAAAYGLSATCFFTALLLRGQVSHDGTEIGVVSGRAAEKAGLANGDRIVAVDGTPVRTFSEISAMVKSSAGETVSLTIERAGAQQTVVVTPEPRGPQGGRLIGVHAIPRRSEIGVGQALWLGVTMPPQVVIAVVGGVKDLAAGAPVAAASGPFGAPLGRLDRREMIAYLFLAAGTYTTYVFPLAVALAVVIVPRRRRPRPGATP